MVKFFKVFILFLILLCTISSVIAIDDKTEYPLTYSVSSSESGYPATNLMDNSSSTFWMSDYSNFPLPKYNVTIYFDYGNNKLYNITNITLQARPDSGTNGFGVFNFAGSNDNISYNLLHYTSQGPWGTGETRIFNSFTQFINTSSYRYYKIQVFSAATANSYVGQAELHLYGASGQSGQSNQLKPIVKFLANPQIGNTPLTITFMDLSTSNFTLTNWLWDFGDGITNIYQNPTHTFISNGNYSVNLKVTDNKGNTNSTSLNIISGNASISSSSLNNFPYIVKYIWKRIA